MNPFFAFCNTSFASTLGLFADYERIGLENVPSSGPLLVVANHQSNLDPPLIARSIGRRTFFLAKREAFHNPLFTLILTWWGAHRLARGEADLQAFRWAVNKLKEPNGSITLYPEGTRNRGGMGRALDGPARIALLTGTTLLPVGIAGSETLGMVARVFYPKATIRVNIGKPFKVEDPGGDRRSALKTLTGEIMGRIAELLPDSYRGAHADAANGPRAHTRDVTAVDAGHPAVEVRAE